MDNEIKVVSNDYSISSLEIWDQEWEKLPVERVITSVSFSPTGIFCALSFAFGELEIWDFSTLPVSCNGFLPPYSEKKESLTHALSWSSKSNHIVAAIGFEDNCRVSNHLVIYSIDGMQIKHFFGIPFFPSSASFIPNSNSDIVLSLAQYNQFAIIKIREKSQSLHILKFSDKCSIHTTPFELIPIPFESSCTERNSGKSIILNGSESIVMRAVTTESAVILNESHERKDMPGTDEGHSLAVNPDNTGQDYDSSILCGGDSGEKAAAIFTQKDEIGNGLLIGEQTTAAAKGEFNKNDGGRPPGGAPPYWERLVAETRPDLALDPHPTGIASLLVSTTTNNATACDPSTLLSSIGAMFLTGSDTSQTTIQMRKLLLLQYHSDSEPHPENQISPNAAVNSTCIATASLQCTMKMRMTHDISLSGEGLEFFKSDHAHDHLLLCTSARKIHIFCSHSLEQLYTIIASRPLTGLSYVKETICGAGFVEGPEGEMEGERVIEHTSVSGQEEMSIADSEGGRGRKPIRVYFGCVRTDKMSQRSGNRGKVGFSELLDTNYVATSVPRHCYAHQQQEGPAEGTEPIGCDGWNGKREDAGKSLAPAESDGTRNVTDERTRWPKSTTLTKQSPQLSFPQGVSFYEIASSPRKELLLGLSTTGEAWLCRRRKVSNFPGSCYPVGFRLIHDVSAYQEREDEFDTVVTDRRNENTLSDTDSDTPSMYNSRYYQPNHSLVPIDVIHEDSPDHDIQIKTEANDTRLYHDNHAPYNLESPKQPSSSSSSSSTTAPQDKVVGLLGVWEVEYDYVSSASEAPLNWIPHKPSCNEVFCRVDLNAAKDYRLPPCDRWTLQPLLHMSKELPDGSRTIGGDDNRNDVYKGWMEYCSSEERIEAVINKLKVKCDVIVSLKMLFFEVCTRLKAEVEEKKRKEAQKRLAKKLEKEQEKKELLLAQQNRLDLLKVAHTLLAAAADVDMAEEKGRPSTISESSPKTDEINTNGDRMTSTTMNDQTSDFPHESRSALPSVEEPAMDVEDSLDVAITKDKTVALEILTITPNTVNSQYNVVTDIPVTTIITEPPPGWTPAIISNGSSEARDSQHISNSYDGKESLLATLSGAVSAGEGTTIGLKRVRSATEISDVAEGTNSANTTLFHHVLTPNSGDKPGTISDRSIQTVTELPLSSQFPPQQSQATSAQLSNPVAPTPVASSQRKRIMDSCTPPLAQHFPIHVNFPSSMLHVPPSPESPFPQLGSLSTTPVISQIVDRQGRPPVHSGDSTRITTNQASIHFLQSNLHYSNNLLTPLATPQTTNYHGSSIPTTTDSSENAEIYQPQRSRTSTILAPAFPMMSPSDCDLDAINEEISRSSFHDSHHNHD